MLVEEGSELKQFGQGADFKKALEKAQHFQKKYKHSDDIPLSELPLNYDFRNIEGYDFTAPFTDQKACGSCYTFGFVQAVQARLKLKYGKEIPQISAQQVLNCNYLVEGCEGGWPHFNAYFMEHAYMVEESCAPYKAVTKGETCSAFAECKPVAKIKSTHLVGGGYAEIAEDQMMKDLIRNGPISVEFQTNQYFTAYQSGIISEQAVIGAKDLVNQMSVSTGQKELSKNLESIIGELNGNTDAANVLSAMGLGD